MYFETPYQYDFHTLKINSTSVFIYLFIKSKNFNTVECVLSKLNCMKASTKKKKYFQNENKNCNDHRLAI